MDYPITEKEVELVRFLREHGLLFGEVLVRFDYQDGVIVHAVIEDKKESVKF